MKSHCFHLRLGENFATLVQINGIATRTTKFWLGYQGRHSCSIWVLRYSKIWNKNSAEKLQVRIYYNTVAVFVVMCCDSQQVYWNNLQQNEVNWLQVSTERKNLQHVIWIDICCDDDVNKRSNPQLLQNFTSCKSVKSTQRIGWWLFTSLVLSTAAYFLKNKKLSVFPEMMIIDLGETEMWVGFEYRFGNAIYYSVLFSCFTCSFEKLCVPGSWCECTCRAQTWWLPVLTWNGCISLWWAQSTATAMSLLFSAPTTS